MTQSGKSQLALDLVFEQSTGAGNGTELDRFQRLEQIHTDLGFLPVSRKEQVEVMMLQAVADCRTGAAVHIAEVLRRKSKENVSVKDAAKAARSIIRSYIDFASDAQASRDSLISLQYELSQDVNPELGVSRVFEQPEPRLLPWLRYRSLVTLKQTRDPHLIGFDPQDDRIKYQPTNPGIMHFLKEAQEQGDLTVINLRKGLASALEHEENRSAFFVARIGELQPPVLPKNIGQVAVEGLATLS